ncbi:MAG: DUF4867 family protein [Lachnospiraceae bacterium]|nr:DUF4867 family protein [Lachnospiraceae bacterium]
MKVYDVRDPEFTVYGRVIEGYDFSGVIDAMKKKQIPDPVEYVASAPELEALPVFREFEERFYGQLGAELGYCMGHNDRLDALEYHRGSEVNIAATDYIVLVGRQQDIEPGMRYDTEKVEAFYVTEGMAVEFYATTLHYCACHVKEEGYAHATFLPRGTNTPLDRGFTAVTEEDRLLRARNKWLIAHPDAGMDSGVLTGLYGPNWTMADLER